MKRKITNNLNLREPHIQEGLSSFLEIIHFFSRAVIDLKSEQAVFQIIVEEITPRLGLEDCVIYKVDAENKCINQVAAYGHKKEGHSSIINRLTLDLGEGFAGIAARDGESILIEDVTAHEDYVLDMIEAGSEIEIPIKINDEVYAVISSEHPEKGFYNEFHVKLFEILASIAVGTLVKIQENEELAAIKRRLEGILERKSSDLDRAIETLSSQYSELKYHHEKRETLIQEVHHRVNNNLQVISSILKLYINKSEEESKDLIEIHNRVQTMALIHQNIYKTMEMNLVDATSYIRDLMSYLKSLYRGIYVSFDERVEYKHMNLDTLVPLGLFITECIHLWLARAKDHQLKEIKFKLDIFPCDNGAKYKLKIADDRAENLFEHYDVDKETSVNAVLLTALIDQLEGDFDIHYEEQNKCSLCFNPVS
ncbi:MAG: sensor histidine kinase [Bacteroidota bacterium]